AELTFCSTWLAPHSGPIAAWTFVKSAVNWPLLNARPLPAVRHVTVPFASTVEIAPVAHTPLTRACVIVKSALKIPPASARPVPAVYSGPVVHVTLPSGLTVWIDDVPVHVLATACWKKLAA